jgi:Na+:H+ antiporter, NhaA family
MKTRLTALFSEFFDSEKASGIVLLLSAITALLIANSSFGKSFLDFWHIKMGFDLGPLHLKYNLLHWINDGLMAVFFLMIGLEIEREIYCGELADLKNAALPIFAALGGMLIPAGIYLGVNLGKPTQNGFGIPMATDIAFALGALALIGSRIPSSIKIFLTAFAIIDDLGAMVVIALFYAEGFSLTYLLLALAIFILLLFLNRRGVNSIPIYLLVGVLMWYLMLQSGVHAAITGVLLAFAIPFRDGNPSAASSRIQHFLHKPVAFGIMPLFALANTGILISESLLGNILSFHTVGIFAGLLFGKPLGILLFSVLAIRFGFAKLADDIRYKDLFGAALLGGIGFTMSIFITILAFGETGFAQSSKIAVILASLASGLAGLWILGRRSRSDIMITNQESDDDQMIVKKSQR